MYYNKVSVKKGTKKNYLINQVTLTIQPNDKCLSGHG